jgi:hypothetical protein
MTETEQLNSLFLETFSNVDDKWAKHLAFWDGDVRGDFNDIAVFVHCLCDSYEANDEPQVRRVFELVERLLVEGSDYIKRLVTFGFLETLQNYASHTKYGYRVFEQYLGVHTLEAWKQIERVWEGKSSLLDVIRAENATD